MTSSDSSQAVVGAGGVVMRGERLSPQVLLVRYRSGAWVFPKGHIEAGETPLQTALREVSEETGVAASLVAPLPNTRYTNDQGVVRDIFWFLMTTQSDAPQLEDTFSEGGFVPLIEAQTRLSHPEDQNLLLQAAALWQHAHDTQGTT